MLRFARAIFILVLSMAVGATSTMAAYADGRSTYIVMPKEGAAKDVRSLIASLGEFPEAQLSEVDDIFIIDLLPEDAAVIAASAAVEFIEQDAPVATSGAQNPTPSWGLDRVDGTLDGAFNYPVQAGEGVIAYVFDTGVAATHPDLVGRVSQGFDAFGENRANTDCHFHGTHVAGTVAGTEFGVAKKASIVPLRVLNCVGSGSTTGVIRAINWTIDNHPLGTPAVANFSLGGGRSPAFNAAITKLVEAGITTVVAAGNERTDACTRSPASAIEAITVGSTDRFDNRSSFSNFGDCVDLFAPGSAIPSADARNFSRPIALSGTSMAAPHVAGVAALVLGQSPNAIPEQVETAVYELTQRGVVNNSSTLRGNRLSIVPGSNWTPIPTIPGAPTGLTSTATGKGFAEFAWEQVASATGYQVEFRKGSQNSFTLANVTSNAFRVEGLSGGEMAFVRVRAVVASLPTKFSAIASARSSVEVPSEPQNLVIDATSKFAMVLSWVQPRDLGGASSITYRVEMKTTGEWRGINSGPSHTLRISDLRSPHQFRIFAINEAGTSASSAEVTFDPELVFAVQTMSATIESGSNVDVSWVSDAPSGTSFQVVLSRATGFPQPISLTVQGNQHRFTGLTRMTGYRVSVRPVGTLRGLESSTNFATAAVAPGAPRALNNSRQEASWLLNFQAPSDNGGMPITSYRLEQLVSGSWVTAETASSTVFNVALPPRGSTQEFRLIATSSVGDSAASSTVRISTPAVRPSAPQSFSAELLLDGRVQMSWEAPADDGGSAVSSYRVELLRAGVWAVAANPRGTTSASVLIPKGVTTSFRVVAVNSAGVSLPAESPELFRAVTVPGVVALFTATLHNGLVGLSWRAPLDDGGSPSLGYRLEQRSGTSWNLVAEGLDSFSYSMPAGVAGELMIFRLVAVNAVGSSIPSAERSVQIPFLRASAPVNFTATFESGTVRLSWGAPTDLGGSDVRSYVLSAAIDGAPLRRVAVFAASARSGVFSGAFPGKTLEFRLHAETTRVSAGEVTEPILISAPALAPMDPQSITGQMRPGVGVQLNWLAPLSDGGSPVLEYRVELASARGWIVLTRTTETSFLAPLGSAGESMLHRVVAVNAVGSSVGSRNFLSRMGTAPATAPVSLSATISRNVVVLSWQAPEVMGGTFSSYEIQQFENGVFKRIASSRSLSFSRNAPAAGQTAIYRVMALTNAGTGAFSTVEISTPKTVPGAPVVSSPRSVGLTNTFIWRTTNTQAGGGALDKTLLYREVDGQWILAAQADASAGTLSVANELFGQTHRYALRFTNEVGESPNSSVITMRHATVVTAAATNLSVRTSGTQLLLAWTNPEFVGGSNPSFQEIQSSVDGVSWVRLTTIRFASQATVAMPAKGRSMNFRVIVINGAGRSDPSASVGFSNPLTAPMGTIGVWAQKAAGGRVNFTVTAPADFGGYAQLSVRIERQGSLAWVSSDEFTLDRPNGRGVFSLPLPPTRGTFTYRVVVSNGSGELERIVSFRN